MTEVNISQENKTHPRQDWVEYFNKQAKGYESCQIEIDKKTRERLLEMFKSKDGATVRLAIDIFKKRNFSEETLLNSQFILETVYKGENYIEGSGYDIDYGNHNHKNRNYDRNYIMWPMTAYTTLLFRTKDVS